MKEAVYDYGKNERSIAREVAAPVYVSEESQD